MEEDIRYVIKEEGDSILDIKSIAKTIAKNRLWILVVSIFFMVMVGGYNYLQDKFYITYSTMSSTLFGTAELRPHLNTINGMTREQNTYELSKELGLSLEKADRILSIDFTRVSTEDGMFTCDVVLKTTDTSLIEEIHDALIITLESNPYLKRRYDLKVKELNSLYKKSLEELEALDELKESTKGIDEKIQKGLVVYPLNIHSEIMSISLKSAQIKGSLDRLVVAQYLRRAEIPIKPNGPSVFLNAFTAFIAGAVLSIIFFVSKKLFD